MSKKTREIVAAALAFVAEQKAAGWTKADFADALQEILAEVPKRVCWLDSCGMASHTHKTFDGKTTVCGHDFTARQLQNHTCRQKGYCQTCFSDGNKFIPWSENG